MAEEKKSKRTRPKRVPLLRASAKQTSPKYHEKGAELDDKVLSLNSDESPETEEITRSKKKVSTETIIKSPDTKEPLNLTNSRRKLQIAFSGFFILGVLIIFLFQGNFLGTPPIVAMILYLLYGRTIAKTRTMKSVFADSMYYMGFLFTFVSLIVSISPLSRTELELDFIIGQMGTALLTTVFGMVVRILSSHFDALEENVEDALREEMSAMAAQINNLSQEFVSSLQKQLELSEKLSQSSIQQSELLNQAIEKLSSINNSENDLAEFSKKMRELSSHLEDVARNTSVQGRVFVEFGEAITRVNDALNSSSEKFETSRTKIEQLDNMIFDLEKLVSNAGEDTSKLTNIVDGITSKAGDLDRSFNEAQQTSLQMESEMNKRLSNIINIVRNK